jgi:DNA-binding MarR family transcriptional regulator
MVADRYAEQLGDDDYRTQAAFRSAVRRFIYSAEEHARAAGIPPQQYLPLLLVRDHPAYPMVTIRELADHLQVRPHSASLLVERAVRRGLLVRRARFDTRERRCSADRIGPSQESGT